jgi:hypothetical protein
MRILINRPMFALALAMAVSFSPVRTSVASAAEGDRPIIRKGVFDGIWHTDPVTIIVEKVEQDGTIKGEIHFDPNGRWGDVRAPFTAQLAKNDSLIMSRDDCVQQGADLSDQIAVTTAPKLVDGAYVWSGQVKGPDFTSPFELRIPVRK